MKLIQAPPILGDVELASERSVIDGFDEVRFIRENEDKDGIVMVGLCKRKGIFKVILTLLVLH